MADRNTRIRGSQILDATITADELAASVAGDGLAGGAGSALSVNVDDSTIEINTDSLRVKADGIGANELDETDTYDFTSGSVSVATPTTANEAANKSYVDGLVNGLDWKNSVRLATNAALPANTAGGSGVGKTLTADANGALTVDGVAVAASDRILVKDESTGSDNGIYTVTATGDGSNPYVLTRATDADQDAEVTANLAVFVEEGTANADSGWVLTTDNPITVDTTAQTYTQFTGLGQITAGVGLTKSGDTIDLDLDTLTSVAVDVSADEIAIVDTTDGSTKKESIADVVTAIAGDGLVASSGVLALDLNELTAVAVDVSADFVAIEDATDNSTKKESIADIMTAVAGDGLSATSGVLAVNVDDTTIETNADALRVKDGGITNAKIADDTIQEPKLNATNAPTDGQVLSYNAAGTNFTWVDQTAGTAIDESDIQLEDETSNVDGVEDTFTLGNAAVANSIQVYLNGLLQQRGAGEDYQISTVTNANDTITFTTAPESGDILQIHYVIAS